MIWFNAVHNVGILFLCIDAILNGHSALVFCHTRNSCETLSEEIAKEIYRLGRSQSDLALSLQKQLDSNNITDLLEQLKRCPAGLDQSLKRSVSFGVAFHHAGLTMDERDIIEGAYRTGVIRVIVATTTLSSGVNLPARRVIIKCPLESREIDVLSYKQMVGRAGRMGKDTSGESFLVCSANDRSMGEKLVSSKLPCVNSCLAVGSHTSLKRAVLEVIASGTVTSCSELEKYLKCTFLFNNNSFDVTDPIWSCLEYLHNNEFIGINGNIIEATPLAEACLSASISPDQGLKLLKELHKARQCFVLETELHVIYQVTPFSVCEQWGRLDWMEVFQLWSELPIAMKRVGELVGVEESFIVHLMRGTVNVNQESQMKKLAVLRRFYTALALQDLVNEVPLPEVAAKFNCSKGMLQSLQQTASTFAGMVTQFSRRLGWSTFELIVEQFTARLQFGVHRELLDLLRLDCLTAVQARALHHAGITGLPDLAAASVPVVEKAMMKALPFQSENLNLMELEECERKGRTVWLPGRHAATGREAAVLLIQEARSLLQRELGLKEVKWMDSEKEQSDTIISDQSVSASPPLKLSNIGSSLHPIENAVLEESNKIYIENKDTHNSSEYNIMPGKNAVLKTNVSNDKNALESQILQSDAEIELHVCSSQKSHVHQNSISEKNEMVAGSEIIASTNNYRNSIDCTQSQSLESSQHLGKVDNNLKHSDTPKDIRNNDTIVLKSFSEDKENSNGTEGSYNSTVLGWCLETNTKSRNSFDMFDSPVTSLKNINNDYTSQDKSADIIHRKELTPPVSNYVNKTKNLNFGNENCVTERSVDKKGLIEIDSVSQNINASECSKKRDSLDMFDSPTTSLKNDVNSDVFCVENVSHSQEESSKKINKLNYSESNNTIFCLLNSGNTLLENVNLTEINSVNKKPEKYVHSAPIDDSDLDDVNFGGDCLLEISFSKAENDINERKRKCVEPLIARKKLRLSEVNNIINKDVNEETKLNYVNKISLDNSTITSNEQMRTCEKTSMSLGSSVRKKCDERVVDYNDCTLKSKVRNIEFVHNSTHSAVGKDSDSSTKSAVSSNCEFLGTAWDIRNKMSEALQTSTPICKKLLDANHSKFTKENTDMFESIVDVNTQLYRIIDGVNDNKFKLNEHKANENDILSDEDTVFATPVNRHLKSTAIRIMQETKPDSKKENFVNKISVVEEKAMNTTGKSKLHKSDDRNFTIKCGTTTVSCEIPAANTKILPTQVTNSYLEAAFAASFNVDKEIQHTEEDDNLIPSSQESTDSVIKSDWISVRKDSTESPQKIFNTNSPNKCHHGPGSDINVLYIGQDNDIAIEDFEKLVAKNNMISVTLIIELYKGDDVNSPSIGSHIIKNKREKPKLEYHHKDTALTGIVFYWGHKDVFVMDLTKTGNQGVQIVHKILQNEEITLAAYSWKEQMKILYHCCKIHCKTRGFDPLVAHWLLKPHEDVTNMTIKDMAKKYNINMYECSRIACDVLLLWDLIKIQKNRLKHNGLYSTFERIEMPTQKILVSTELSGFCVNNKYVDFLWNQVDNKIIELQETTYKLLGRKFNFHSSKCIAKIKQELLTKAEYKEVSENVLDMIHQWRKLKLLNVKILSPLQIMTGNRVYGNYVTHSLTGRISMREPNIQSVPRDFSILNENISFRTAFISNKGNMLISADFCQLELRLLAHFSQDQNLQSIFKKQDDIFTSIAAQWNSIPEAEVTDVIRQQTKQLCYGIIYGMGPKTLSSELNVDVESAADMISQFKTAFPGIQNYIDKCIEDCRHKGYVTTIMGRNRYLPDIRRQQNKGLQRQAERQAVNTTIQGSAADIVKKAMVNIENDLRKLQFRDVTISERCAAHLVLQLHDELIYEVSEDVVNEVVTVIRCRMESAVKLNVALPVKIRTGLSWGKLTVIK